MQRLVTAELDLQLFGTVDLVFQIAAATTAPVSSERLTFAQGDRLYAPSEIVEQSGSRLHSFTGEAGPLRVRYQAAIEAAAPSALTSDLERIAFLRPSRYSPSDEIFVEARRRFGGFAGADLIGAVSEFVASTIVYTPGMSLVTDTAMTTLRSGRGVCRDYAHLVIALLRAMDVPARYVSCYAPGLHPMDFHAVAEAYLDGAWYVIDATRLADRRSLVRIATGRDAADCAFLSYHRADVGLDRMLVDAAFNGGAAGAPSGGDDHAALVQLA